MWWSHWQRLSRAHRQMTVIGIDLGLAHPASHLQRTSFWGKKPGRRQKDAISGSNAACSRCGSKRATRHVRHLRGHASPFPARLRSCVVQTACGDGGPWWHAGARKPDQYSPADARQRARREHQACRLRIRLGPLAHLLCGHQARNNRRSQSRFVCRACGFELHADLNAARNIAAKYRASRGTSSTGAPWSTGVSSPVSVCRASARRTGGEGQAVAFRRQLLTLLGASSVLWVGLSALFCLQHPYCMLFIYQPEQWEHAHCDMLSF